MILSISSIERLLVEVSQGITADFVKQMVEAEIPGCVVEQVTPMDRHRRTLVLSGQVMPVYDLKEGPWWNQGSSLYLVIYRKDMGKQFKDTIKKMEKAAAAKVADKEAREEAAKEMARIDKINALRAELKAIEGEPQEVPSATES